MQCKNATNLRHEYHLAVRVRSLLSIKVSHCLSNKPDCNPTNRVASGRVAHVRVGGGGNGWRYEYVLGARSLIRIAFVLDFDHAIVVRLYEPVSRIGAGFPATATQKSSDDHSERQ